MLIVNLTTTRQRFYLLRYTLLSLVEQNLRADQIVIWVSEEPYLRDKGMAGFDYASRLEEWIPDYKKEGVEIRRTKNTGPYRKLIPALRDAKDGDLLVTADDDIIYHRDWLSRLMKEFYTAGGDKVVASRVRKIRRNVLGIIQSYVCWRVVTERSFLREDYVITFGAGAVLKKSFFRPQDIENNDFATISPTADDLWYTKLLNNNGVGVVCAPSIIKCLHFINHADGLDKNNLPALNGFWVKVIFPLLARLGFKTCKNDYFYRSIRSYFKEVQR